MSPEDESRNVAVLTRAALAEALEILDDALAGEITERAMAQALYRVITAAGAMTCGPTEIYLDGREFKQMLAAIPDLPLAGPAGDGL